VEERIVDVCAVEILRSVDTPRAEDTASAEVDIWAHEETGVEVVVAMETGGIRLGASPDVVWWVFDKFEIGRLSEEGWAVEILRAGIIEVAVKALSNFEFVKVERENEEFHTVCQMNRIE
jgi:hypothetical protein